MNARVAVGLERCLQDPPDLLRGARLGLLCNQASVDAGFRLAHEVLAARFPGQLVALFGPQHGLCAEQQDNMVETPHQCEPRLGVPVYSLYAERREPDQSMLEGLDVFVADLQDVGCRVYTFGWTLVLCLRACAARRIPVLVLDRPNPLGGELVEGAPLDPAFASFVGGHAIPMRHGMTLGELARRCNEELGIRADLHVVPCAGLTRGMTWRDTGRAWVPPSPNLPRIEGVDVYCGQVLLEGTNLSEGRGTTTPFEIVGAPFLDPYWLRDALAEHALPGVVFRPIRFEPTFHKWQGQSCSGLFLHATDLRSFRPYRTSVTLLWQIARRWPAEFRWRQPPYEYEHTRMPIDILAGSAALREAIDSGGDLETALAAAGAER